MKTITLNSRVRLRAGLEAMDIDEATVIANAGGDYGLELIARRIWQLIPSTATVAEVCEMLLKEYEVDRETCQREVLEFLNDSTRQGLTEAVD